MQKLACGRTKAEFWLPQGVAGGMPGGVEAWQVRLCPLAEETTSRVCSGAVMMSAGRTDPEIPGRRCRAAGVSKRQARQERPDASARKLSQPARKRLGTPWREWQRGGRRAATSDQAAAKQSFGRKGRSQTGAWERGMQTHHEPGNRLRLSLSVRRLLSARSYLIWWHIMASPSAACEWSVRSAPTLSRGQACSGSWDVASRSQ